MRGELIDLSRLEESDRLSAHGMALGGSGGFLRDPVTVMLERIGGQVDLAAPSVLVFDEVGTVAGDVGRGDGLGDLTMVGATAAQGLTACGLCLGVGPLS